jgi:hypothetical protein
MVIKKTAARPILYLLIICSITSCIFSNKTKHVKMETTFIGKEINFLTKDSINIKISRAAYFEYLLQDTTVTSLIYNYDKQLTADTIAFDSIYVRTNNLSIKNASEDFVMQQLENGEATLTDMRTGEQIKKVTQKIRYYRLSRFSSRRKMSIGFYYKGEAIFRRSYIIIDW